MRKRPVARWAQRAVRGVHARLSYANVTATLALFVALGGSAYALQRNSVGSKELKPRAVGQKHIKNRHVRAKHLQTNHVRPRHIGDEVVMRRHLADGVIISGPVGPQGEPGPEGPVGPQGPEGPPGSDATIDGLPAGGDLAGSYPTPVIAPLAVTGAKLADTAVGADKLADRAIRGRHIAFLANVLGDNVAVPPGESRGAEVICPTGTRVISGGGFVNPVNVPDIALINSARTTLPDGWRVTGRNDGSSTAVTVRALAVCIAM